MVLVLTAVETVERGIAGETVVGTGIAGPGLPVGKGAV